MLERLPNYKAGMLHELEKKTPGMKVVTFFPVLLCLLSSPTSYIEYNTVTGGR